MTKAKILSKNYGGVWTYNGLTSWFCDDEKRHVARTCSSCDEDDRWPPNYWLYGDGSPQLVNFWSIADK